MILLLSSFLNEAVIPVIPDLSLIASLKTVRSEMSLTLVVVITAASWLVPVVVVPVPIVKPTLPVAWTFEISAFVTAVAVTPVSSDFWLIFAAAVFAEEFAAIVTTCDPTWPATVMLWASISQH